MNDILKGNFQVKCPVEPEKKEIEKEESRHETISKELKKRALGCLGGSMVYIEREKLTWDGEEESTED